MAPPPFFDPAVFGTEVLFALVAVVSCFLIYFKTRESYELTKHEGIRHFRDAFLFFGLSYALRFLLSLSMLFRFSVGSVLPPELFFLLSIILMSYFSTMGIFYLIFSSVWKKLGSKTAVLLGHGLAILLALVSFLTRSNLILLGLQCGLLIAAVLLGYVVDQKGRKLSQIKLLYLLVAVLWLIELFFLDRPRPLSFGTDIFYVVSLAVFIVIYQKVSKWAR